MSRPDQLLLAAWIGLGLGLYAFQDEIIFALWVFAIPIFVGHLLWGVCLLFVYAGRALADHWFPAWPAATLLAAQVLFVVGSPHLTHAAALGRLVVERPTMQAIIANAAEARRQDPQHRRVLEGDWEGVRYVYDFGPPVRVAFEWYNGIGDWAGVVWDPSGAVTQANGWDTPRSVQGLFGGVLLRCRPLWSHYYRCAFT